MEAAAAEFWATVAGIWLIGLVAGGYTIYGGLKAVVRTDMVQFVLLVGGGVVLTVLAVREAGGEIMVRI